MLTQKTVRKVFDNVATCSLLIVLLILVGISIISIDARRRFVESNQEATQSYQVIGSINSVLSDLKDAETGQRGYLLTGDTAYLEPFYVGVAQTRLDLSSAQSELRNDGAQEARLALLQDIASKKILELESTISIRQKFGLEAALKIVQSGRGRFLMDQARSQVAAMAGLEQGKLTQRNRAAVDAGNFTRLTSLVGSIFGVLLIGTAIVFVAGYLRQREEAEAENLRLIQQARDTAVQQRIFLKDVLMSVTEGRLSLCDDEEELPEPLGEQGTQVVLTSAHALRDLRQAAISAARESGFHEDRVQDLATSVSEAGMNAIIHGGGGDAVVRTDGVERVQVWIKDHGKGIALDSLPKSTLKRGYSSAGTLGHGFWLMLQMTDRLYLLTGAEGTTIVLEQAKLAGDAPWTQSEPNRAVISFKTGTSPTDEPSTNIANRYYRTLYP